MKFQKLIAFTFFFSVLPAISSEEGVFKKIQTKLKNLVHHNTNTEEIIDLDNLTKQIIYTAGKKKENDFFLKKFIKLDNPNNNNSIKVFTKVMKGCNDRGYKKKFFNMFLIDNEKSNPKFQTLSVFWVLGKINFLNIDDLDNIEFILNRLEEMFGYETKKEQEYGCHLIAPIIARLTHLENPEIAQPNEGTEKLKKISRGFLRSFVRNYEKNKNYFNGILYQINDFISINYMEESKRLKRDPSLTDEDKIFYYILFTKTKIKKLVSKKSVKKYTKSIKNYINSKKIIFRTFPVNNNLTDVVISFI